MRQLVSINIFWSFGIEVGSRVETNLCTEMSTSLYPCLTGSLPESIELFDCVWNGIHELYFSKQFTLPGWR